MSERVIVHEFDHHVSLSVPSAEMSVSRKALNAHHMGRKTIPMAIATENVPKELRQAHHMLQMTRMVKVRVRIWSDGEIEMLLPNKGTS